MIIRIIPALVLFLSLAGCATVTVTPEKAPPPGAEKIIPESLRAEAVVELKRAIPVSGKAMILVKGPDKFRIEVAGPFGQVMGLLLSDGRTLSVFSGAQMKTYSWDDPFFPYPFSAREIVSFLLGNQSAAFKDRTDYRIKKGAHGRISEIIRYRGADPVLTARLSDYREISGAVIPFDISIDGRDSIRIRYSSVEVDPELERGLFTVPFLN